MGGPGGRFRVQEGISLRGKGVWGVRGLGFRDLRVLFRGL